MPTDVSIRIAGKAGQGIQSISSIIGKIFTQQGYYVFTNPDVESRIRGGHNFEQVRIKSGPVFAVAHRCDILAALDSEMIREDLPFLSDAGVMIFDGQQGTFKSKNPNHVSVPLEQLAVDIGKDKIMVNTVATGAIFALLDFELDPLLEKLTEIFGAKGKAVAEKNRDAASAGYRYIGENFKGARSLRIPKGSRKRKKLLLNGSQAMAAGAICAGLKFYSGYPMSPSTAIMEFVAAHAKDYRIIMEPAEDEISAINMIIGASFAGVRSMTATSGGGFCLMVEGLGLAGMTETPVVVVVAQRAGPSTGLPTRTEQSDLRFAIHASHGEFPRAVFAPGHAEQAFYVMGRAFNMAEKYQTPVVVLGDQYLNDSFFSIDALDPARVPIIRGHITSDKEIPSIKEYKRYAWRSNGISPRILPGQSKAVLYADSDEHTDAGHITESGTVRNKMMRKRMQKLAGMKKEMNPPVIYPAKQAESVMLCWGSTYGAVKEAVDLLNGAGHACQMVHFCDIHPFPKDTFSGKLSKAAKIFSVENNFAGQFADSFHFETGRSIHQKILKYDGRPFTPQEIVDQVENRR